MHYLSYISRCIGIAGAVIILWGTLISFIRTVKLEALGLSGQDICSKREITRHHFGSYILLGLEFLIAADIVDTIIKPSINELIVLGSVVLIRTVLSFFLNREISSHDKKSD